MNQNLESLYIYNKIKRKNSSVGIFADINGNASIIINRKYAEEVFTFLKKIGKDYSVLESNYSFNEQIDIFIPATPSPNLSQKEASKIWELFRSDDLQNQELGIMLYESLMNKK